MFNIIGQAYTLGGMGSPGTRLEVCASSEGLRTQNDWVRSIGSGPNVFITRYQNHAVGNNSVGMNLDEARQVVALINAAIACCEGPR